MQATQTTAFSFPVEVTLKIGSVSDEWIEGELILKLFGHEENHHFKTKNNADIEFDIPVIDAHVSCKIYLENPKRVCVNGNVEKKIIFPVKVPFGFCVDI